MFSLALRRLTRADDPQASDAVGMGNDQDSPGARHSDGDKPLLGHGMLGVVIGCRQGIAKDGRRFVECDPVLSAIFSILTRVPFKIHHFILTRRRLPSNNTQAACGS